MTEDPAPHFEHCGEVTLLTIKHILVECPQYQIARLRAFNRSTVTLKSILKDGDTVLVTIFVHLGFLQPNHRPISYKNNCFFRVLPLLAGAKVKKFYIVEH